MTASKAEYFYNSDRSFAKLPNVTLPKESIYISRANRPTQNRLFRNMCMEGLRDLVEKL